jgi:hypothetical protein
MQNATRLCVGGMLLFLGAASPALAQVTMLNADNPANSPAGAAAVQGADGPTSRPSESAPKSLIVTGPVNTGEAVPNINLDKLLSEQSGAPITNKADAWRWVT